MSAPVLAVEAAVLIPYAVTPAMLLAGTSIAAVDAGAGEVAWSAGTAYAVGARVHANDAVWEAVAASTGVAPGTDATRWLRAGPSNRMAPFDDDLRSRARAAGSLTYVLAPGFFTGLVLEGMQADRLQISIVEQAGGALVQAVDIDLRAQAEGLFELLFLPLVQRQRFELRSLPLHPGAQVSVTLSADAGAPVALGLLALGSWDSLVGDDYGGVTYGARASMVSYSHREVADDGTVHRVRRGSAARLECEVFLPAAQASRALELLQRAQGRAVAFVATGLAGYDYLSGFGDLSGHITASSPRHALLQLDLEGAVQ